jgi:DNA-binding transcriptional ArsR family regulator
MSDFVVESTVDNKNCHWSNPTVNDLEVIDDPLIAIVALDPIRAQLLAELKQPASAGALATRLGLPRQKINYHLKALEAVGLVHEVQRRLWGGLTERRLQASAQAYLVAPRTMGPAAPAETMDPTALSIAAKLITDVASLLGLSRASGKRLATMTGEFVVSFESPSARDGFQEELREVMAALVAKYHAPETAAARPHRVVIVAHPAIGSGEMRE